MNLFYLCGVHVYVVARIIPAAPKVVHILIPRT